MCFFLFLRLFFNGQCFGNPNPYNLSEKYGSTPPICTAARPHLYRRTFLASKLRRKGNPAIRLPFVCSTPPICTAVRPPFVRQYPLTRNYYENNSPRITFRNFRGKLRSQNLRERKTFFQKLRVRFVIFQK